MSTPKTILRKYGISPLRGLGQNFLIDKFALKKLISAAELKSGDAVLEIGPGIGALTKELAKRAGKVFAIEKDSRLIGILKETLHGFDNVKIIRGDILKFGAWKLFGNGDWEIGNFKVVANLPFYLTAPVIRKFLELEEAQPHEMVFIVQKEVAQRICAKPPEMSLLAVSVQFYAKPKIIAYVPKSSFWPQPKVDSAIIKIVPHQFRIRISLQFCERFFKIVKAGFSQPRKQLANNLSKGLELDKTNVSRQLLKNTIRPEQRAETLTVNDWINLAKTFDDKKK